MDVFIPCKYEITFVSFCRLFIDLLHYIIFIPSSLYLLVDAVFIFPVPI